MDGTALVGKASQIFKATLRFLADAVTVELPHNSRQLFGRLLQWRHLGQDDPDSGAFAGLGIEVEPSAQPIGHDAVDDMQAEPCTALVAPRREKRIEGAAGRPDSCRSHCRKTGSQHCPCQTPGPGYRQFRPAIRKGVSHRIEEQVGQNLPVGTGITVHREIGLAVDRQRQTVLPQSRPQTQRHLLGQIAEVKGALVAVVAVGGHLLEGLDQFGGAIEVCHQLRGGIAAGLKKLVQAGTPEIAAFDFVGKHCSLAFQ